MNLVAKHFKDLLDWRTKATEIQGLCIAWGSYVARASGPELGLFLQNKSDKEKRHSSLSMRSHKNMQKIPFTFFYVSDYLRVIGAWNTHKVGELAQTQEIVKYYSNSSGNYSITYINK